MSGVLEYMVTKKLSGELKFLVALREYFINNESPSDIAVRLGVSKFVVRGWIQRVLEKCGGSHARARKVITAALPYVLRVDTIVLRVDGSVYCLVCGRKMKSEPGAIFSHIYNEHRDLVLRVAEMIERELRCN